MQIFMKISDSVCTIFMLIFHMKITNHAAMMHVKPFLVTAPILYLMKTPDETTRKLKVF